MTDLPRVKLRHCPTCRCEDEARPQDSPERVQTKKMYAGAPKDGCLDYRLGKYCGERVTENDRCEKHQKYGLRKVSP